MIIKTFIKKDLGHHSTMALNNFFYVYGDQIHLCLSNYFDRTKVKQKI